MKSKGLAISIITILIFFCNVSFSQSQNIKSLKESLPKLKDSTKYVDVLNRIAFLSYEDEPDSTFIYALKTRAIVNRIGYSKGKITLNNTFGIVFFVKGNHQLALRYFNDSYNQGRELRDTAGMMSAITNIACCYVEIGKNKKAIEYYKKAIDLAEKGRCDSFITQLYMNYILQCSNYIPVSTKAKYIKRAQFFARKFKDDKQLLAINQIIADEKIKQNHREEGIRLLQQTLAQTLKSKLYFFSMDMLIDIGRQLEKTDINQTIKYYKQGLGIAQEKNYQGYIITFSRKLYEIYAKKKDFANAYQYSRVLIEMRDEKIKTDSKSGIDYLEYAMKDEQLNSALLQKKYQSYFLYLSVTVCILTGIIMVILWYNWKKTQKIARALRIQFIRTESTMEALEVMNTNYAKVIKVVAHDLRNPIGAIKTITDFIIPENNLPKEIEEHIELIRTSSISCLDLISELLKTDFDQKQDLKYGEINLHETLQQCIQLLRFRAKEKDQELVLTSRADINLQADKEKLLRVFNNLITNAIKFSPVKSKIYIDMRRAGESIIISVQDNGVGIPQESMDKIFDPFTTARRRGTKGEEPFGLGLYISKRIIEAHQGKIWVSSVQNKGTIFYMELPNRADAFIGAENGTEEMQQIETSLI